MEDATYKHGSNCAIRDCAGLCGDRLVCTSFPREWKTVTCGRCGPGSQRSRCYAETGDAVTVGVAREGCGRRYQGCRHVDLGRVCRTRQPQGDGRREERMLHTVFVPSLDRTPGRFVYGESATTYKQGLSLNIGDGPGCKQVHRFKTG